jgi:hypothetical protein
MTRILIALCSLLWLALPAVAQDEPAPGSRDGGNASTDAPPARSGGAADNAAGGSAPSRGSDESDEDADEDAEDGSDDEVFIPTEEIPADQEVTFPVDI